MSRTKADGDDDVVVNFEDTRAMELLSSYRPLILDVAKEPRRSELTAWAGIPPRLRDHFLYLSVSSGAEVGHVVCGRMTVFAIPAGTGQPPRVLMGSPKSRVLHHIRPPDLVLTDRGADDGANETLAAGTDG